MGGGRRRTPPAASQRVKIQLAALTDTTCTCPSDGLSTPGNRDPANSAFCIVFRSITTHTRLAIARPHLGDSRDPVPHQDLLSVSSRELCSRPGRAVGRLSFAEGAIYRLRSGKPERAKLPLQGAKSHCRPYFPPLNPQRRAVAPNLPQSGWGEPCVVSIVYRASPRFQL